jgi:capsular exopolysaccharide synthesis family protein
LKLYDQQVASLERKKNEQLNMASELDAKITEGKMSLAALERARDASDAAYRGVLARIQEARMAADENTATIKVAERAQRPEKPVRPRPLQILFLAVLLGLGGGTVLALLVDKLEDRLDSPDDVARISGLRVLAIVPHVASRDRNAVATASINYRFSEVAEAFASLRSMLDSPQYRERSKVILVASSIPGEGKTITSCNLAAACAKNGQRILLIDFDLRRSRLAGIFPMPAGTCGLLEFLNSEQSDMTMAALGYPAGCDNLTVIASRPVKDASPAELMGGAKVAGLVNWARANFDRVIIDAPPLGLVSDALVLAAQADCVLMMARPDVTHKRLFLHVASRFREAGVGTLASVVNDVDFSKTAYGAYSPYYHYQKHYKSYTQNADET